MPKTEKARRFFAFCAHTDHPPERCPNRQVSREMSRKPLDTTRGKEKKSRK